MSVHRHIVDEHEVLSREGDSRKDDEETISPAFDCPECGEVAELDSNSALNSEETVERFSREIKMLAVDRLLGHLENQHGY